jgi:drug/metabolite transporter superfamily protein YnfA
MPVYYRGPDGRRPDVVITDRLVRVRVPGGWRVWAIAEMRDIGVAHSGPDSGRAVWALGTSAILIATVAHRLRGWSLAAAGAVFVIAVMAFLVERRRSRERTHSELWVTWRGAPVVVFALPQRHFRAACRGLIRALDHREDVQ